MHVVRPLLLAFEKQAICSLPVPNDIMIESLIVILTQHKKGDIGDITGLVKEKIKRSPFEIKPKFQERTVQKTAPVGVVNTTKPKRDHAKN